jgi:hypothetical protein
MNWKTPSRSSPKAGSGRGCLCPNGKYSRSCCDGSLQAQGIGNITGVRRVRGDEWQNINTNWEDINRKWDL